MGQPGVPVGLIKSLGHPKVGGSNPPLATNSAVIYVFIVQFLAWTGNLY